MVVKANIVKNQTISVDLNQKAGGFNAPVQSVNGKTGDVILDANDVGALPDTTSIPSKVSELENDEGYLTGFSESDPTVPAWAKEPQKPSYTFAEVGADPEGSAVSAVSNHNTDQYSHQDIRLLIEGLNSRLNALADSDDVTLDQMSELVDYIKDNRDLIEGITTNKVNVSDIINNLTTNVSNKPLSAAQGVALKSLIDAIPNWAKQPTKPTYTYDEVGADKAGTAVATVDAHNESETAHNDIRMLIQGLSERLNAVANSTDTDLDQLAELVAYIKANRGLIEEVTTKKVNVSDIINNLTTNVENKPLSAAMGVELRNMIAQRTPTKLSDLEDDSSHRTVTDDEKIRWNSKSDFSGSYEDLYDKPYGETWLSTGSDTVVSDDVIYDAYYKVSDATPSLADIQNGCEIIYYRVSDGAITGDPIVVTNSTPEFGVISNDNGLLINLDGGALVIVSYTGIGVWGSFTFPDITTPGTYFRQVDFACTHSFKLTGYNGFPMKVTKKIEKEWLPDDAEASAFNFIKNDTFKWNGDVTGKTVIEYEDENIYAHVSDIILTSADLQGGGSYRFTDYEDTYTFTGEDITETDDYIVVNPYSSIVVAKKDNVVYEGSTFPVQGLYLSYTDSESYLEYVTINGYKGFIKPILKMDSLTDHDHDWYGKPINKGNTVRSDGIVHGGYVKVSDSVPTEAELRKGGVIRHYNPDEDGNLGELITGDYLGGENLGEGYSFTANTGNIVIGWGLFPLVVVSLDGNPKVGALTINAIDSPGVYFMQNSYGCVHSLTINEYEGFDYNVEKVPAELLPDDIGGGVSSWNDLTDKPFGETTVMGDTLTWDGDMTGKVYVEMEVPVDEDGNTMPAYFVKVSDTVPTFEDLQSGGTMIGTQGGDAVTLEWGNDRELYYIDMGAVMLDESLTLPIIVKEDNADLTETLGMPLVFPEKGVYFINIPLAGIIITSFTINNYTGFEMEVVETIDPKYLPSGSGDKFIINIQFDGATCVFDKTFAEISQAVNNGENIVIKFDSNTITDYDFGGHYFGFYHMKAASQERLNVYDIKIFSNNITVDMYSCNCTYTQIV